MPGPDAEPARPRLFLDTSVVLAAAWSPTGGSNALLRLAQAGRIELLISRQVLLELDDVLQRKAPDLVTWSALFVDRARVTIVPDADAETNALVCGLVSHPEDAGIAAAAIVAGPDYLVTLDRKHLIGNDRLARHCPFPLGTPGDALAWCRERWEQDAGASGD